MKYIFKNKYHVCPNMWFEGDNKVRVTIYGGVDGDKTYIIDTFGM